MVIFIYHYGYECFWGEFVSMEKKCCINDDNSIEIPDVLMDELNWKKGDSLTIEINKNNDIILSRF